MNISPKFSVTIKLLLIILFSVIIAIIPSEYLNPIKKIILSLGVVVIIMSALTSAYGFVKSYSENIHSLDILRYELGAGILFGLELMVGADIIETVLNPSYYDIGLLGLLIIIRTFLSFFLNMEMKHLNLYKKDLLKRN